MSESVDNAAVGVSAKLSEIGEPRVGAFDGPERSEGDGQRRGRGAGGSAFAADDVFDAVVVTRPVERMKRRRRK